MEGVSEIWKSIELIHIHIGDSDHGVRVIIRVEAVEKSFLGRESNFQSRAYRLSLSLPQLEAEPLPPPSIIDHLPRCFIFS